MVCPRCDSGFIEEVSEDSRYSSVLVGKLPFWLLKKTVSHPFFLFCCLVFCRTAAHHRPVRSRTLCSRRYVLTASSAGLKNSPPSLWLCLTLLPLWSLSELWQLLFMERSALLSHPPSSESDPDDGEQVSAGQSRPSPVSPGAAEAREPESPSQPGEERSPRSEQRPAVEGCVGMVHRNSESV